MKAYDLLCQMDDNSVDAIITDPPYRTIITDQSLDRPSYNRLRDDKWDLPLSWVKEAVRVLKDKGVFYIFCGQQDISYLHDELYQQGAKVCSMLAWVKTNPIFSKTRKTYRNGIELALYGCKGSVGYFREDATQSETLLSYRMMPSVQGKKRTKHPTQKPLKLIEEFVLNSTRVNDVVLDPFMGSGTTAVACVRTGRKFLGSDIEQEWIDVANIRISQVDFSIPKIIPVDDSNLIQQKLAI